MEFTVNKAELLRELNLSQGVVERKTTIPILSNILFEADSERIRLTATDLELGIRCSCPAQIKKGGAGTIPAKRLLDYVRLLPDGPIQVKFGENGWANLNSGRSKTRIVGMGRESFPELPEMPAVLADIPVQTLTAMITRTIFAISAEESRFTLNGALLLLNPAGITMVATDGHRLSMVESTTPLPNLTAPFRALLPRKAMAELLKLGGDAGADATVAFSADDNHLYFQLGDRLLSTRKLTGNFPDFERVLPKEHPHSVVLQRDELRSAIERVSQFSDERSRAIRLQVMDGEVKVHSSLSETGESEESLPVTYTGDTVDIGFNASYLLDFLKAAPEEQAAFYFRDSNSAGELRPGGDAPQYRYRYVVMPMRI